MNDELKIKNNELGGKMNYRYRTDEEMKDSGVEWIGKIPKEWINNKISREFEIIGSGSTPLSSNLEYYNGDINWLLTGDLTDGYIYQTSKKITQKALKDYSTLNIYPEESLIIAMYGATIGKTGLTKIKTTTNQACCVLANPKNLNIKFAHYWFIANKNEIVNLGRGGGQPNISQDLIKSLKFSNPLKSEQDNIVKFLDEKTAEFDSIISKKEALIEKLEEAKKSLISEVVTGKVKVVKTNDGYELVERKKEEMKDSGVEWIGKIPKGWECNNFRRSVTLKQGLQIAQSDRYYEAGDGRYIYITVKYINSDKDKNNTEYILNPDKGVLCNKEDVLLARTGATGKVVTNIEGVFHNNFFKIIYDKSKLIKEYLVYYLIQKNVQEYLKLVAGTTTIPDLNHGDFLSTKLVLPNKIQQEKIVEFLNEKTAHFDSIISKKEALIEKLKEAKQSLISEAVTGKIEIL